ncbi:MAG: prolyl oligopeptidase family serine peptidase [Lachnospiraceae bacterium]|nr:prolyl oligopeptidase family serine peptidase [Lachnospiraceae bacterium]
MKLQNTKKILALALTAMSLLSVSCSGGAGESDPVSRQTGSQGGKPLAQSPSGTDQDDSRGSSSENYSYGDLTSQSFAQAHDAFQTTLAREENDSYSVPAPADGFELVAYPSKIGDMAAYVSADPGDGEKHPIIIWVVGGWGNGIDDFPWCYPEWDNDQTGSAFWQEGILTMYPSFRGGNGNPGYYETLFGEVDDIISACEYAASLPYVDPDRIYLGGHSTGGTRALLAAEYSDMFRAVFCFGAVDEIKYHNNSQFTFDTSKDEEYVMRSPIYWLKDVKNPTFLIEGSDGNSDNLRNIQNASENNNINCYILEGHDHFSVLAPVTRLLAEKILADTEAECNISITQEELESALNTEPEIPLPAMLTYNMDALGLSFSLPYIWEFSQDSEDDPFCFTSPYDGDNIWDMSTLYMDVYSMENPDSYLADMAEYMETQEGYQTQTTTVDGAPALDCFGSTTNDNGSVFRNRYIIIQREDHFVELDFYIHESFESDADTLYQTIIDSLRFTQPQ